MPRTPLPRVSLIGRHGLANVVPYRIEAHHSFEMIIGSHGGKCRHGQRVTLVQFIVHRRLNSSRNATN
jgi:hypothetical protein